MNSPLTNGNNNRREETNVESTNGDRGISNQITRNEMRTTEILENEIPVKVPIVGFETMEERAKFTVFKLRVENEKLDENWLVFRRYTDFVRLHSKLKDEVPNLQIPLPPKRWLRDNFETTFLEERMKGLQAFVDSILVQPHLAELPTVRKFFCLDEPPVYSDIAEESKSWYGAMEDSAIMLKHKLNEKDREIELLLAENALVTIQRDNLLRIAKNCRHCVHKQSALSPRSMRNSNASNPISSPAGAQGSSSSSSDHGSLSPRRTLPSEEPHESTLLIKTISSCRTSNSSSIPPPENDRLQIKNENSEDSLSAKVNTGENS